MTLFWLVTAALAAAVLYHLLRSRKAAAISRREANIAIYRDQLRELEADLKSGLIGQGDYERARRELEGRLLDDAAAAPAPRREASGRRAAWALAAGIPIFALGVYFDDSQMFDLLRLVRADALHASVPVVCVRGRPGFTAVSSRSLEIAVKALGADEFIELPAGENGDGALRAAVARLMASG